MEIVKTIIPASGLDTRFLPFTKAVPKELLPILNKPAIQYIAEEAIQSEITNFMIVTGQGKHAIFDHFDSSNLSSVNRDINLSSLLSNNDKLVQAANFSYVQQNEPLGIGHAIWMARHFINKEYFSIGLPDDLIISKQPALGQLIRIARQEKASIIAVQEVPTECISNYGVISIKKQITPNLFQVSHIVDKPHAKDAPSSLAMVGRFVLSYKIFNSLEQISSYSSDEIKLSDGISHMIQQNERVFAYKIKGTRYDLSTPLGWIKAIIGSALQDPGYAPHIRKFLTELQTTESFLYNPTKAIEHTL